MEVNIHDIRNRELKFVVIAAFYDDEWLMVRHMDRSTYEIPGGHIEAGESPDQAAQRELFEETGALEFDLEAVGDYSVKRDTITFGRLYIARINKLGPLPKSEIAEVKKLDKSMSWTYEAIQPHLFNHINRYLNIRPATERDGKGLHDLFYALDGESNYMMYEVDERKSTVENIKNRIKMVQENGQLFVVDENGISGFVLVNVGSCNRISHVAYIVIGIKQSMCGKKYGTLLLNKVFEYAKQNKLHRLELTVMTHNENAINLYKKMGFEIEGTKVDAMKVDGVYVDEYQMSKLI